MQNMPALEHIDAMSTSPTAPAGNPAVEADAETPPQAARELTQTDHLNRRLLKSLLDNMQFANGGVSSDNEDGSNEESNNEFEE
ncbi:uncharacterized protein [Drosophila kikkawai]|uniref:Uncharacterized protein n=1 Tax=Drosophila kikkawai TaxID=30033 RepID=A0A6P4IXV4_DROKI|nr:uncharacterized protein LOC108082500 [Drosophila kikkawai]